MRSTQPNKQARRVAVEDVVPVCREASPEACNRTHARVPPSKMATGQYLKYAIFNNMTWAIKYHDDKLQAAVLALPAGILARYFHCTDRMQVFGPDLGMPHTRAMGSGLFELRLKSREGIGRVFYCTLVKTQNCHAASVCEEDRQDPAQRIGYCAQAHEGVERC